MNITKLPIISTLLLASITLTVKADVDVKADQKVNIQSSIVSFDDTHLTPYDGSVFHTYFMGESVGTKDAIVGLAIIEPGHEIHPPHKHAEEEYLLILEGSGEWSLNGKKTPAKAGDVLYVSPWDMHGIFNTGKTPMKFFITRANSKGLAVPKESKTSH
ncbi:dimethylsulfonioproprionate lyase family protein [Thalassotalea piscium]